MQELPNSEKRGGDESFAETIDRVYAEHAEEVCQELVSNYPWLAKDVDEVMRSGDSYSEKLDLLNHIRGRAENDYSQWDTELEFESVDSQYDSENYDYYDDEDAYSQTGRHISRISVALGGVSLYGLVSKDFELFLRAGGTGLMVYGVGRLFRD